MRNLLLFLTMVLTAQLSSAQTSLPVTLEDGVGSVTFTDFDGGTTEITANPFPGGLNTSSFVAEHVRDGGQNWAGTFITLTTNIDFSGNNNAFKMKVYSPATGIPVLFKLENAEDGSISTEVSHNTTVANEWEEMVFNFSGAESDTYAKIVIIFNLGTLGDGTANSTYYFDDIEFFEDIVMSPVSLPVTFEETDVNFAMADFGGNSTELGQDPENAANTVAITTDGSETWAGTTIGADGFNSAFPFTTTETKMNLKVYSPAAGIPVRLKVEDHTDPTKSCETEALTTVENAWEVLEFDFSNQADGTAALNTDYTYDMMSVFFDFGSDGTSDVFYWDDIRFGQAASSASNISDNSFKVYPNPAKSFINFTAENISSVTIFNISGQKMRVKMVSENTIDISTFQKGVYLIRITDITGNTSERKFVKF